MKQERIPIIGKNDHDIKLFKKNKLLVKHDYAKSKQLIKSFYLKFKDRIREKVVSDAVFISVPSTSTKNLIPNILCEYLANDYDGKYIDGDNYLRCSHTKQAKSMLNFEKRCKDPIGYRVINNQIKDLANEIKGMNIYLVDDVLGTGESVINFSNELKKHGIKADYVMCMKNVEVRYPTERDINRLYDKLKLYTGKKTLLKKAINDHFWLYPKMKINRVERSLINEVKKKKMTHVILNSHQKVKDKDIAKGF